MSLNIEVAEHMGKDEYKRFVDGLVKQTGTNQIDGKPKFDESAFEMMKFKLKSGL